MAIEQYEKYQPYLDFIKEYAASSNAATGSKVDANANVECKNVTTLTGELYKKDGIGINRLRMWQKIKELYGQEYADKYIYQLDHHFIYRHDETNPCLPYCVSITMYPFLFNGLESIGGGSSAPHNLDSAVNLSTCALPLHLSLPVQLPPLSLSPILITLSARTMATIITCTLIR